MASRMITRLSPKNSVLFVCDMQERFSKTIAYFPAIVQTAKRLVDAARILDIPIVVTEQYPKGLGHTVPELGLADEKKYPKTRCNYFRKYAFKQMDRAGAVLTTSECVVLGLLQDASHPKFKEVQKLILEPAPDVGLVSKM
ncbi:unnamed protein product [Nippostrongylus brasiliensis]|uniref:Isochorismatase domain-containing protein 1 n=1 Tax=Nippostrongylus brasiliensis TaxID=27835 RepID=A0A0N4YPK7_NIPBR|nr:unnamed protein product [Nippostrongylus brasiliensis]